MNDVATPRAAAAADVVATSCPRCGAPLDFAEASNAVRCRHCSVVLLVTGRRRVLSYTIATRVGPGEARALAGFTRPAKGGARAGEPRLLLVPYYRLAAEEVYWQRKPVATPRPARLDAFADVAEGLAGCAGAVAYEREDRVELELAGRRIERNFLACEAHGLASWSLGVRPSVLRLELFQRDALERDATVLRPSIAHDVALARALEPTSEVQRLQREVLRVVLSVVYFPLWVVEMRSASGARVTVVDAVSGTVVACDADPPALEGAASDVAPDRVLGFRPLTCPNCAWDLPVRPDDVAFHCASCERTWELAGEELEPIRSDVVVPAAPTPRARAARAECHLPVWEVSAAACVASSGAGTRAPLPERLYAPAFRWRALKGLCDLGARLSRREPDVEPEPSKAVPLVGCSLDRGDAVTLARLIALRLVAPRDVRTSRALALPDVDLGAASLRLLWLPFSGDAYSLRARASPAARSLVAASRSCSRRRRLVLRQAAARLTDIPERSPRQRQRLGMSA